MAYKMVCVYEFHDDISGKQIHRGDEIYDQDYMAKLIAANREHHFNRVYLLMDENQWEWPPKLNEPAKAPAAD